MKINVQITEGGFVKKFISVEKLKINNADIGESIWIPAETVEKDSLIAEENGIYYASDDDAAMYDSVTVNVQEESDQVTTKDKRYYLDDGNIAEMNLPNKIVVVKSPDEIIYDEDENVEALLGIIVKAYFNDAVWNTEDYPNGTIPYDELEISGSRTDPHRAYKVFPTHPNDEIPVENMPFFKFYYEESYSGLGTTYEQKYLSNIAVYEPTVISSVSYHDEYNQAHIFLLIASSHPGVVGVQFISNYFHNPAYPIGYDMGYDRINGQTNEYLESIETTDTYTYANKTVYFCQLSIAKSTVCTSGTNREVIIDHEECEFDAGYDVRQVAWAAVYGEEVAKDIEISWNRPYDSEMLTTYLKDDHGT